MIQSAMHKKAFAMIGRAFAFICFATLERKRESPSGIHDASKKFIIKLLLQRRVAKCLHIVLQFGACKTEVFSIIVAQHCSSSCTTCTLGSSILRLSLAPFYHNSSFRLNHIRATYMLIKIDTIVSSCMVLHDRSLTVRLGHTFNLILLLDSIRVGRSTSSVDQFLRKALCHGLEVTE